MHNPKNPISHDLGYLLATLAVAKTLLNGYYDKKRVTGAILVHTNRILAIGYDNPETGETAELMALSQVGYDAPGAILYTSMAPSRMVFYNQLPLLLKSKISCLIYGYCDPVSPAGALNDGSQQNILRQIEEAGIQLSYLRMPELLGFYAPYRFAEVAFSHPQYR
jgi:pyrimidine deaminase RibD-like protein